MGYKAGEYIAKAHPMGSGKVKVAWFPGPPGAGWVEAGNKGFQEAVAGSDIEVVETRYGDTGKEVQLELVEDTLEAHPDIAYVVGTAVTAEAAVGLLRARGLSDDIKVMACYFTPGVFRGIRRDQVLAALEYAARINGFDSVDAFVRAHSGAPWFVTMVGFVAGLPFMFQMVDRRRQIEVPKYLRPRTDTPKLTVGYGGCFACIYSVRGAGGYQMFGITPMPIFDPKQEIGYLGDFMVFFKPGDIVKFRPIDRAAYDEDVARIEANRFEPLVRDLDFSLREFHDDIGGYHAKIGEVLHGD